MANFYNFCILLTHANSAGFHLTCAEFIVVWLEALPSLFNGAAWKHTKNGALPACWQLTSITKTQTEQLFATLTHSAVSSSLPTTRLFVALEMSVEFLFVIYFLEFFPP